MSFERYLPRSLRARFTLISLACATVIFLLTGPLTVWQGRQLLFEREVHNLLAKLDAVVSKGDSELHAIRLQAIVLTDLIEQWDPKGLDSWYEVMESSLRRLPKAHGVRMAFETESVLGPKGIRSMYLRRGEEGEFVRFVVNYDPADPELPGGKWYAGVKASPMTYMEGVWSDPYTAPEVVPDQVFTCSVPVTYVESMNHLFAGVAAIDVTVQSVRETLRQLKLADRFQVFLLDPGQRITLATCNGGEKEREEFERKAAENAGVFRDFSEMRQMGNSLGWFVATNPFTGEESCFFYGDLPHNPAKLVYVIPKRELEGDENLLVWSVAALGVVGISGMGLLTRWSAGLVTRNLNVLRKGVENLRAGNLRSRIPPAVSHDETADVIAAFNGMVDELQAAFLRAEEFAKQQQRIATEFELARVIQQSALPGQIWIPGGKIHCTTMPAQEIGGDFYDAFVLPGGRVALAVGDVSGKGVSAAMFMVRASLLLRTATSALDLRDAVAQVNAMLSRTNPEMMFVTLFVAVWDLAGQTLCCVNAGHNPPVLLRAGGEVEMLSARSGPALGAMGGITFKEFEVPFRQGDLLAVYTDGISEAPDFFGAQFGVARMVEKFEGGREQELGDIAGEVVRSVLGWQGGGERFDDITLLLARAGGGAKSFVFSADVAEIERVVEKVEEEALAGGMGAGSVREVGLAACEVVTNIITHALGADPGKTFRVDLAWTGENFVMRFEDGGPPFDPESLPTADLKARLEDRPIGGLGWVLINKVMDLVQMERVADVNILILSRSLQKLSMGEEKKKNEEKKEKV